MNRKKPGIYDNPAVAWRNASMAARRGKPKQLRAMMNADRSNRGHRLDAMVAEAVRLSRPRRPSLRIWINSWLIRVIDRFGRWIGA